MNNIVGYNDNFSKTNEIKFMNLRRVCIYI